MSLSTFSFPTKVLFGAGSIKCLPAELERRGVHRPLLVTDNGLVNTPLVGGLRKLVPHAAIFSGVDPNPTEKNVLEGVAFYREHNCDGIIALGGGSPIDAAKAIRLKVTHELDLSEYDDNIGGDAKITPNMPPNFAVPTTAGTGSEVGRSSVITLAATNRKTVIFSPFLIPDLAIADPELTLEMPAKITAGTAMDAFTHNVEAYFAKTFHPICDAIALRGAKTVALSN
jgi:4-hydroxybutyrate dehydrogenase